MFRLLFIYMLFFSFSLIAQEYIEIIKTDINIRMHPTTSSTIVGHAFLGEVYKKNGENAKWYSVILPSGETRWIYKKLTKIVDYTNPETSEKDILIIQDDIKTASNKASLDSNNEIINGLNKVDINNILLDRYVLLVLQKYSIDPAQYDLILNYKKKLKREIIQPVANHLVSVSHIDYDLFKIDFANIYIETKRCFKLGTALDAEISIYYDQENYFVQELCFEDGYGKGFNNCYTIKHIYESVLNEPNLIVLTNDGKIKKTNLVLKETILNLPE